MSSYRYDLHLHSCLSPCADDDMTPANMAGMAMLNGLQLAALTDHNSCKNCPAFFTACRAHGIVPVAGMELNTAEEIHLICLFPTLESAMAFDAEVEKHLMPVKNRPAIFGNQLLMDAEDTVIGTVDTLLITASALSLSDAAALCSRYGGASYPAHIDRTSNGILAVLGALPETPHFPALELSLAASESGDDGPLRQTYADRRFLHSSDAHHLWDISEGEYSIELDDEPYSAQRVRDALIAWLRGTNGKDNTEA